MLRACFFALLAVGCGFDLAPLDNGTASSGGGSGGSGASSGGTTDAGGAPVGGSGGGGATGGAAGSAGASGAGGTNPCDAYCQAVMAQGCSADTGVGCASACAADLATYARCANQYLGFLTCAVGGTWQCVQGYADSSCNAEWLAFLDCTWFFTPQCGVPASAPSGGSCYAGASCDPVTNSCTPGDICGFDDADNGTYTCYPGPNSQPLCGACDYSNGPYCVGGLECVGAGFTQCARFCCTDADCGGAVGSCIPVGYYSGASFCGSY